MEIITQRNADNSQGLIDLIEHVCGEIQQHKKKEKTELVMIEVGSYSGESADIFCSTGKVKTIWCIDPWIGGYDSGDAASSTNMNLVESKFDEMAKKHEGVVRKFKGTLQDFVEWHPDISADLIYIDANHQYEFVKKDIQTAKKMKVDFISGHDWHIVWQGVIDAVSEELGQPDSIFQDNSWVVKWNGKTKNKKTTKKKSDNQNQTGTKENDN